MIWNTRVSDFVCKVWSGREGDAREGRGRGGTDSVGNLHMPDCDARDGGGPHARVWRGVGLGGSP